MTSASASVSRYRYHVVVYTKQSKIVNALTMLRVSIISSNVYPRHARLMITAHNVVLLLATSNNIVHADTATIPDQGATPFLSAEPSSVFDWGKHASEPNYAAALATCVGVCSDLIVSTHSIARTQDLPWRLQINSMPITPPST